jgi:hypothetical protein
MRLVLVAVLAFAACGRAPEPAAYGPEVEINFMRACMAQAAAADGRCPCIWERVEAEIPPADLAALEALPPVERAVHPLQRQIEEYALACIAERNAAEGTPPPAPR